MVSFRQTLQKVCKSNAKFGATKSEVPIQTNNSYVFFSHPLFMKHQFKHPFQYWLPLLGLYTGARLNELCQLYLKGIYCIEGIWVININADTPDKKLKTLSAARSIVRLRLTRADSLTQ